MNTMFQNAFKDVLVKEVEDVPKKTGKKDEKLLLGKKDVKILGNDYIDNLYAKRDTPKDKNRQHKILSPSRKKNVFEAAFYEETPATVPTNKPSEPSDEDAWKKSLDKGTNPADFDSAENPALKLDTEGVEKARNWIKKLENMAEFVNGTGEHSLNSQINALELRSSIPFKGVVRREEKRITKIAENLRGLAEVFKSVVIGSQKKIHDATAR